MLNRRLQVLLDDERYHRLKRESEATGVPVGEIVRRAIDRDIPATDDHRRAAARRFLEAAPMAVPDDPADLEREIMTARGL